MDEVWIVARALLALACVLGLIWWGSRRLGGGGKRRPGREPHVVVVERAALGRRAGVAVLAVGNRRLLVGFAEQQVTMLSELSPVIEPLELPPAGQDSAVPKQRSAPPAAKLALGPSAARGQASPQAPRSALAGSLLHPQTWKDTVRVLQEKTVRR